jgi:hypothetical protein
MSITNAEKLAEAVKAVEVNINTIEELVAHSFANADFNFVDQFRGVRGATLEESGLIMKMLVGKMQDKLGTLANVLYIRELESTRGYKDPWREAATEGRRVEAIATLRKFAQSRAFDISEARDVVDAYLKHQF